MRTRGLSLGGAVEVDQRRADEIGQRFTEDNLNPRVPQGEPRPVQADRADYNAAYNSTSGAPSQPLDGVSSGYGRVWAEARGITHSGGSGSVAVVLISSQNGVRAIVTAPPGQTITGGSVRFWTFDPITQTWAVGAVDESLQTGARSVATSDQFVTVGAQ